MNKIVEASIKAARTVINSRTKIERPSIGIRYLDLRTAIVIRKFMGKASNDPKVPGAYFILPTKKQVTIKLETISLYLLMRSTEIMWYELLYKK